jgi:hypothetical protein
VARATNQRSKNQHTNTFLTLPRLCIPEHANVSAQRVKDMKALASTLQKFGLLKWLDTYSGDNVDFLCPGLETHCVLPVLHEVTKKIKVKLAKSVSPSWVKAVMIGVIKYCLPTGEDICLRLSWRLLFWRCRCLAIPSANARRIPAVKGDRGAPRRGQLLCLESVALWGASLQNKSTPQGNNSLPIPASIKMWALS